MATASQSGEKALPGGDVAIATRVAGLSVLLNALLAGAKYGLGAWSGSMALRADAFHSAGDVIASLSVLVGIFLSRLRRATFPYGLYKVENLVALLSGGAILLAAWEIAREAVQQAASVEAPAALRNVPLTILGAVVLIILPLVFSRYEARMARETGSPALEADSGHMLAEVFSGGVIIASLAASGLGWHFDWIAALVVAVFVARTGWHISVGAIRVLLDASVEREVLNAVEKAIVSHPSVVEITDLRGRNAGSFRFIQASVVLNVHDLELAHEVSQQIEQAVKKAAANVDDVVIHYAPYEKPTILYGFTLDENGTIAEHFGDAPEFEIVTVDTHERRVAERRREPNRFGAKEHGRGIKVAQGLLDMGVDVVVTRTALEDKGPYFALHDARVRIVLTDSTSVEEVLQSEGIQVEATVGD